MKKFTPYILIVMLTILVLGVSVDVVHAASLPQTVANIAGSFTGFTGGIATIVTGVVAAAVWLVITVAAWLLAAAGTILNVSMYLTTHLGMFINQSPAIYTVWTIIRDISSTLLIFFILYAAIQMILGLQDAKYGELIKSIIIVGVLINFSFFFTRALIDLSNIVSLEFYNAMAPTNTVSDTNGDITNISKTVGQLMNSGGVSDILMGALQIDNFWKSEAAKPSALFAGNDYKANINIIILEVAGIAVVVLTIINFIIISMICVARIAILIFLLAFSPIWIAAMGMPKLKELSDVWTKQFKTQLLFLPTYLAFLYVAMRIVTASNLSSMIANQNVGTDSVTLWGNMINLLVGFSIIIIIINIPIIAAAKIAGVSGGFMSKAYGSMTKKVKGWTTSGLKAGASGTWNNTGGRVASSIAKSSAFQDYASRSKIGELALKGSRGVATNYNRSLDAKVKAKTEFAESLGYNREAVETHEYRINNLRKRQAILRSRGDNDGAKALDNEIKTIEQDITAVKDQRKTRYAERAGNSLWSNVSRSNKVAAAKISIETTQKRLEAENKSLEKVRDDIKSTNTARENLKNKIINQGGMGTIMREQQEQMDKYDVKIRDLSAKEANQIGTVGSLESDLSNYKNITS
ncbi:MAG: hypothetical protein WCP09_00560 [Candidatus Taylorbacteria bacterium]